MERDSLIVRPASAHWSKVNNSSAELELRAPSKNRSLGARSSSSATFHCKRNVFRQSGFTLIELVVVIFIIGIISAFAALRLSGISSWKHESEIRKFANTLELVIDDASAKTETYQFVVNLDKNYYQVFRVIPEENTTIKQVDYLENLRLDSEKARRKEEKREKEQEKAVTLNEEFEKEDTRQSGELDKLYFASAYRDPYQVGQLGVPLSFPSLQKETLLSEELRFRDVTIDGEKIDSGEASISITPQGINTTVAVRILIEENVFTIYVAPGDSQVQTIPGEGQDLIENTIQSEYNNVS